MNNIKEHANSLINEKSPYLLQHAHNPVNWYAWGQVAFDKAIGENKPIFLSIGYSTCHWCHVMEKESFEDQEVAALLNNSFISIKVDREERPDVDHLYMEFCQALTGSGGWPLTIIMTPEKKPFFAGTYFPKTRRYGRIGLTELLQQVGYLWETDEKKVLESAEEIVKAIQSQHKISLNSVEEIQSVASYKSWGSELLNKAYEVFQKTFDPKHGGFGHAPKFPTPHILGFLLRYAKDQNNSDALAMVKKTLDEMSKGGIYDHIGFGFSRYSTDEKWLVPHFEKMLYDNALLSFTYLESYQFTHDEHDLKIAKEIFTYVLRDMTSPEGGFYSAEDADSEGVEGKFYVWSVSEIVNILEKETADIFCSLYDISPQGNFEGKNIPNLLHSDNGLTQIAPSPDGKNIADSAERARQQLYNAREQRIHPHKDDKILTSWNGLMIASLSKGAQIIGNSYYLDAAEKSIYFIKQNLIRKDGRLLARFRDGEASYLGYLDDYAFLIWGLIETYTASGKSEYLKLAVSLQNDQEKLFKDSEHGGYFLTGSDAEELLFRPKESYDGALPSGNSISALNLLRLSRLTGDEKWFDFAERLFQVFRAKLSEYPTGYTAFLQAIQYAIHTSQELVLSGSLSNSLLKDLQKRFFYEFRPYSTVLYQEGTLRQVVPWIGNYPYHENEAAAYLCQNFSCQKPVKSLAEFDEILKENK